jgi:hypothetical protein
VLSLPQMLQMILPYYIASSAANVLENFIGKEYGKDIKGTLSSLTLDSLTGLTLPHILNDIYLLASYLSGTGINVGMPSNPIGIFSAALAVSPFVYLIAKRYLSKETITKFKNFYDFLVMVKNDIKEEIWIYKKLIELKKSNKL